MKAWVLNSRNILDHVGSTLNCTSLRLPRKHDPIQEVSIETLAKAGVLYWKIPILEDGSHIQDIDRLMKERNYKNRDEVILVEYFPFLSPLQVLRLNPTHRIRIENQLGVIFQLESTHNEKAPTSSNHNSSILYKRFQYIRILCLIMRKKSPSFKQSESDGQSWKRKTALSLIPETIVVLLSLWQSTSSEEALFFSGKLNALIFWEFLWEGMNVGVDQSFLSSPPPFSPIVFF